MRLPFMLTLFATLLCHFFLEAKTICLHMVVGNDNKEIKSCLESLIPLIDEWIIVDTSSNDTAQNIIKETLKGIPGKIIYQSIKNRGEHLNHNCDYTLFAEPQDRFLISSTFNKDKLSHALYSVRTNSQQRIQPLLQNNSTSTKEPDTFHILDGIFKITKPPLAKAPKTNRTTKNHTPRYIYFLGKSALDAHDQHLALKAFQRRSNMAGDTNEIFDSLLQIGIIQTHLNKNPNTIIQSFLEAHLFQPERIEPLIYLAQQTRSLERYLHLSPYGAVKVNCALSAPPILTDEIP